MEATLSSLNKDLSIVFGHYPAIFKYKNKLHFNKHFLLNTVTETQASLDMAIITTLTHSHPGRETFPSPLHPMTYLNLILCFLCSDLVAS